MQQPDPVVSDRVTLVHLAWIAVTAVLFTGCGGSFKSDADRVLIIGMDGMDHQLVEQMMNEGKLPNFARLRDMGGFRPLTTSIPPESPVAWSNVISGRNPGGHGVKDFFLLDATDLDLIHEDESKRPLVAEGLRDSVSLTEGPDPKELSVFGYKIPLPFGGPTTTNARRGKAFWQVLENRSIPATINRMPANFPPVPTAQKTLTGMGTPELLGGTEAYTLYTDNLPPNRLDIGGGRIERVYPTPDGRVIKSRLFGPPMFKAPDDKGHVPDATIDFVCYADADSQAVKIVIDDEETVLVNVGEWSRWVRVSFELFPFMVNVDGICRFLVQELSPDFRLYVSSIQFDPAAPAAEISTPADYSAKLSDELGLFHTKGLPMEYKALDDKVLRTEDFVGQMEQIRQEEFAILAHELDEFESGVLFCYFSHTDLPVHNLWNLRDPDSPTHDPEAAAKYGMVIEDIYRGADESLGDVLAWLELNPDVDLLVISDHGMAPYHRSFNLNTWLHENGYLVLKDGASPGDSVGVLYDSIDWSKTRAYGFGFAGIFINLSNREAFGIVSPEDASGLMEEIRARLLAYEDPEGGARVFKHVYRADEVYSGEETKTREGDGSEYTEGPELIVGTYRGYRVSDDSAQGNVVEGVIEDNLAPWSGDHSMAHDEVPGILFSNRPIAAATPALYDITATVLAKYGISAEEMKQLEMIGKDVFKK